MCCATSPIETVQAVVENEEHFLLHCHVLNDKRKDLFNAMCKKKESS